uniref:EOG090X0KZ2 n=1 Tax=Evadne anonyx TaxID=141404 RepID=A0A9N6WY39_9CRUS|nr:EOG090X0KZ2 [Evadne anonyx]
MENMTNLESEALKRKKRLEALRNRQQQDRREPTNESEEATSLPKPMFRSYKPLDEELQKSTLAKATPEVIDELVTDELGQAKQAPVLEEIDLSNLAPRKPDWDLKRVSAKKLAKLEKRTQRAIAMLIRERLMETKQDDLVSAVNALKD